MSKIGFFKIICPPNSIVCVDEKVYFSKRFKFRKNSISKKWWAKSPNGEQRT